MNPETFLLLEQWLDAVVADETEITHRLAAQKGSLFGLIDILCIRHPEISAKLHSLLVNKTQTHNTETK